MLLVSLLVPLITGGLGKSIHKQTHHSILVTEDGNSFNYELVQRKGDVLEIWPDISNRYMKTLIVDDPMSAAVLASLSGGSLCLIAPKTKGKVEEGGCFKIGLRDLSVVSDILTQCDGKIILPLQATRCTVTAHQYTSINSFDYHDQYNRLNRRRRDLFGFIKNAADSVITSVKESEVGRALESAGKAISKKVEEVATSVKNSDVGQSMQNMGTAIQKTAEEALLSAKQSEIGQAIQSVGKGVKTTAEGIVTSIKNTDVGKVMTDVGNSVADTAKTVQTSIEKAVDKVIQTDVGQHVSDVATKVKDTIEGSVDKAAKTDLGQGISDAAKTVKSTVDGTIDKAKSSEFGQGVADVGAIVKGKIEQAAKFVVNTANDFKEKLASKDEPVINDKANGNTPTIEQI